MMTRAAPIAAIFLAAAQLTHAGTVEFPLQIGGAYSVPVTSIKELRYRKTIRQKYDFSCGSAALSTLLTYHYSYPVTEQGVFEEMWMHGDRSRIQREGFSLLDMKMFLKNHGFQANGYQVPLAKLAQARIPAIVLLRENGYSHFVVVKGIRDNRILIGDPAGGTKAMTLSHFESIWINQIVFIIENNVQLATFNSDSDWRAAPRAPLVNGINREGLSSIVLPKMGPSDF